MTEKTEQKQPETQSAPAASKPSFGERMAGAFVGFVRFLARLIVILLILGLIAGALYLAVPYAYRHYVRPLEELQARVDILQEESVTRAKEVNQQLVALQESIAALQSQQAALAKQLDAQQADWEAVQARLDELEKQQSVLSGQLDNLNGRLNEVDATVGDVRATAEALQENWQAWEPQLQAMQQQVVVLRVLESLTRARVLIGQANYGLAADELKAAQASVAWLQAQRPDDEALPQVDDHLTLAWEALPQSPDVALKDIEAAWQLLSALLPTATPTPEASPTAEEATPTPTPTPSP